MGGVVKLIRKAVEWEGKAEMFMYESRIEKGMGNQIENLARKRERRCELGEGLARPFAREKRFCGVEMVDDSGTEGRGVLLIHVWRE